MEIFFKRGYCPGIKFSLIIVFPILMLNTPVFCQGNLVEHPIGTTSTPWGFVEYLPVNYNDNPSKLFPVIIHLSGVGEAGNGSSELYKVTNNGPLYLVKTGKWPVLNKQGNPPAENFMIFGPQSPGGFFDPSKQMQFINYILSNYRADPNRIYILGLSAGAFSVWDMISAYPEVPAAVIPIAGKGLEASSNACEWKNVPIWAFHGDADPTVGIEGSIVPIEAVRACDPPGNPRAKFTVYPGVGHNSWARTYDLSGMGQESPDYDPFDISIYDWLLQYSLGESKPVANAGQDISLVLPANSTNLSGSGYVSGGTIVSYAWTKINGPSQFTLTNSNKATATVSDLVEGTYTFRLTVTDDMGQTASDDVKVIVTSANVAPSVELGANITITLPVNSVSISSTASDPDGTIVTYEWTQRSGPATATLSGTSTGTLNASDLVEGTYRFRLTVTDNDGASSYDQIYVIVNPGTANSPPVANAGPDQQIKLPANSITLSGSGSDTDGSIASYLWEKISGPTATLVNADKAALTVNDMVAGSYTFRLTVTDNEGASDSDDVNITVSEANQPPTANAGPDQQIKLPTNSITLSGSGSDTDGSITTYLWEKISGPTATLVNADKPVLTVNDMVAGSYTFRLTVTDNDDASDSDDVNVTVSEANQPPTANAGPDRQIKLPTNSITLSGSGSDTDGSITTYLWEKISGPSATLINADKPDLTVNDMVVGIYLFRLTVTDSDGASDSDDVNVTVSEANQPPTVNAGPNQHLTQPVSSTDLTATASDPDGYIAAYLWEQVSGPLSANISNATQPTTSVSGMDSIGNYRFSITVTDNEGATGSEEVVVIINSETGNELPVADAGPDQQIKLPTNSITLSGSGSDTDGSIVSYLWEKISGPTATLIDADTPTLTVNDMVAGNYTFRLTVTDNDGAGDTDNVNVTVSEANQPPTANAGPDQQIKLPTNSITLSGSGSDPDGSIANYLWEKISGPSATLVNADTQTLTVNDMVAGNYTFRLTVTDNEGAGDTDNANVMVSEANQPPTVNAGPDLHLTQPASSTDLTATASDPDGSISAYLWEQVSGPSTATITDATKSITSVSEMNSVGTYKFSVTVTDDEGATGIDEVSVIINPEPVNDPPSVNAGPDQFITLPVDSVTLYGSATDNDGTIISYHWIEIQGGAATLSGVNEPTLNLTNLSAGNYQFELTVTDNDGDSNSDQVKVTVYPEELINTLVAIAGDDQVMTYPQNSCILHGKAESVNLIVSFSWEELSGPSLGALPADTCDVEVTFSTPGTYVFRLTVEDNLGQTDSDEMTIEYRDALASYSFPKFFSPNGDGINDIWILDDLQVVKDYELKIFDKYGNMVFEANPYQNDWNGTINGSALAPGAYYYIFKNPSNEISGGVRLLQ